MQKVTAFLERYVEWVALGIGGLFLLLMVFLYVLQTPISDNVGGRSVTLATVESDIYSQTTSNLEAAMNDAHVPSEDVPPYGKMFVENMSLKSQKLPTMVDGVWISPGAPLGKIVEPGKAPAAETPIEAKALPVLPTPRWYADSSGKSTVLTDPNAAPRAMAPRARRADGATASAAGGPGPGGGGPAAGGLESRLQGRQSMEDAMEARMARMIAADAAGHGGGGRPAAPPAAPAARPAGAGAAPAAGALGAPAEPEVEGVDKVWVTAAWEIGTDDLAKAFTAVNVPAKLTTEFLRLETTREELLPDGTWGHTTTIKPLAYHSVPEMPAPGAGSAQERTYDAWASANAQTLLVPSFYPLSAGDEWYVPGQPNPNEPVTKVVAPVQPVQPVGAGRNMRGGAGAQQRGGGAMAGRRSGGGGGGGGAMGGRRGGGAGGGGAGQYAPDDQSRPPYISYQFGGAQDDAPGPNGGRGPRGDRGEGLGARLGGAGGFGGAEGGGFGPMRAGANAEGVGGLADAIPDGYTVPRGAFVPSDLNKNVLVWIHDDTVQPGKTYRYKMRYVIKNPFYGQSSVKDPEVAKKFAIYSNESEWSDDVVAPSILRFFVATGIASNAMTARFDVYRWQKGVWHQKLFSADPGDIIGGKDGPVDYSSGYCLVDVKPDAVSHQPVTISDDSGRLEGRNFQEDQGDVSTFKKEIGWQEPAAVVVPGATGGPQPAAAAAAAAAIAGGQGLAPRQAVGPRGPVPKGR